LLKPEVGSGAVETLEEAVRKRAGA